VISLLAHEAIVRISCGIPSATWHPSSSTALYSSFFSLSLSLFLSALLAAINPLSSAGCNDAAIGGTISRAVPVLVNLWMSTEAKSYRYLPRGLHEWSAIRKSSAMMLVCAHDTGGASVYVRERAWLFRSERKCVRFLKACECVLTRISLCTSGVLKRRNVRVTVIVDGFKCIRF